MAQILLYRGGNATGIVNYDCTGQNIYSPEAPSRIAVEYQSGNFTMTFPIAPVDMKWQRNAFLHANPVEGDFLSVLRIPARHEVRGVVMELQRQDVAFAGWKFVLEARLWEDGEVKEVLTDTNEVSLAIADGDLTYTATDAFDVHLLPNQYLELGVKLTADEASSDRRLADFTGLLSLTANVQTFAGNVRVV